MKPGEDGCLTKLGAIATVVGVIVAVVGVAITWYYSKSRVAVIEVSSPAVTSSPAPGTLASSPSVSGPKVESAEPPENSPHGPSPSSHLGQPAVPLDLTLLAGEQRTFLGDQASVAAEFNQIGSEEFVTLRVTTIEGGSVPHVVLSAGARFPIRVAGNDYSVYVISVDKIAQTVDLRISRNSVSQERKGQ